MSDPAHAFVNARNIMNLEQTLGINFEQHLNHWTSTTPIVADITALEYHTLHWWVTIGVFVWLIFKRPDHYRFAAMILAFTNFIALIGFYYLPTAPPRMMGGFADIMAQTSGWGWWSASGTPGPEAETNNFAAMPSLHCGWAIWCGVTIFLLARHRWVKVLGIIYPLMTTFSVMATANHYFLDVVGAVVVLAMATALTVALRALFRHWLAEEPTDPPTGQRQPQPPIGTPGLAPIAREATPRTETVTTVRQITSRSAHTPLEPT